MWLMARPMASRAYINPVSLPRRREGLTAALMSPQDRPNAAYRYADDDAKLPDAADEFFELLPGGRVLDVRLVDDDAPDWNRIDAMVPVRGLLACGAGNAGEGSSAVPKLGNAATCYIMLHLLQ